LATLRNTVLDPTFPYDKGMRVSFSLMETSIFHNMPPNARQGYALCKILLLPGLMPYTIYRDPSDEDFDIDECPEPIIKKAGISSYLLKNALFAELEQCSSDSSVDCFSISVYEWKTRIFLRLYKAVSDRRLPSFFMPAINLLQSREEAKRGDNIFLKFDFLMENDAMFFRDDTDSLIVTAHVDHDDDADMTESCAMKQIVIKTILCLLGHSVAE
jgi:hypothetical protein